MGKITIKHFLNLNLKPYLINGEKYYSIYLLVTANRMNTKIKSKIFEEYYTEKDFLEITDPNNEEEAKLIFQESNTIKNIVELLQRNIKFDTTLFAAIYNYFTSIFTLELELDYIRTGDYVLDFYNPSKNKLHIGLDRFFTLPFSLADNQGNGMSVYKFFSPESQEIMRLFLEEKEIDFNIDDTIIFLNDLVFYKALDKLGWILKGSKKYKPLLDKYILDFDSTNESILDKYNSLSQ